MTPTEMLTIAAALVATMFGLLATVLGFFASRTLNKQDQIVDSLVKLKDEVVTSITVVKDELHDRISEYQETQAEKWNGIERRLSVVETRCVVFHKPDKD